PRERLPLPSDAVRPDARDAVRARQEGAAVRRHREERLRDALDDPQRLRRDGRLAWARRRPVFGAEPEGQRAATHVASPEGDRAAAGAVAARAPARLADRDLSHSSSPSPRYDRSMGTW